MLQEVLRHRAEPPVTGNLVEPGRPDQFRNVRIAVKTVEPVLKEVAEENDAVTVGKLNVDENPATATKFDILSIPTLLVFVDGQIAKKLVGAMPKKRLLEELAPYLG